MLCVSAGMPSPDGPRLGLWESQEATSSLEGIKRIEAQSKLILLESHAAVARGLRRVG